MSVTVRGPRSRWVGPPLSAPKGGRGRSPGGRQRHYGAVELAGAGAQVNVNDVVEIDEISQQGTSQQRRPLLAQVLSMWEDTFTGVFKFRARLLIHSSDLPEDALSRLRAAKHAAASDSNASGTSDPLTKGHVATHNAEDDEVFLTARMRDLEVRSIVKPVTLATGSVGDVPAEWKGKMGPRLTHAFSDSSGEFIPVEGTDAILTRARVRQSEAIALASRADQENDAAKNGKPIMESNGWLLPKRGAFGRRVGVEGSRRRSDREVDRTSASHDPLAPTKAVDVGVSDGSEPEELPNSEDAEWKQEDADDDLTDTDSDFPRSSGELVTTADDSMPRKSPRQRKSPRSPAHGAVADKCSEQEVLSPASPAPCIPQGGPTTPPTKAQGPIPPRPRRLAMPPVALEPTQTPVDEDTAPSTAKPSVGIKVSRTARTRMATGGRTKNSQVPRRSPSVETVGDSSLQLTISGKRKRGGATKMSAEINQSDYPPRRTPVGKDYQTEIPDLLPLEDRKPPPTGTGARMVWRSVRDWDPHSRGMLAGYLHAAKGVVQTKQARPGVAVHVRLGGDADASGDQEDGDGMGIAGSYAVWAVTAGRDACGVVRVACSKMAQTEVPRSAVQRVQCEEEALAALVKTRCVLDNFEAALEMLANDKTSPESIEPWTLDQVRTLEKVLEKEFDPNRRLHGWARPGMEMDREDFINLATVSQQVPGKTPAQVLSFYYRYLAAAEPLTDVVYGAEAAEARKQEYLPSGEEADIGRSARGGAPTTRQKPAARHTPIGPRKASPAHIGSASTSESPTEDTPRIIEPAALEQAGSPASPTQVEQLAAPEQPDKLAAPKQVEPLAAPQPAEILGSSHQAGGVAALKHAKPFAAKTSRDDSITADAVNADSGVTRRSHTSPSLDGASCAMDATAPSGDECNSAVGHRAPSDGGCGGSGIKGAAGASQGPKRNFEISRSGGGGSQGSASEDVANQRRWVGREGDASRTLPPNAEVLEIDDSDDADGGGVKQKSRSRGPGIKEPTQQSDMEAAARHLNSMGPAGLSWVARQLRRQATPAIAQGRRPSRVRHVSPPSGPHNSGAVGVVGGGRPSRAMNTHSVEEEAFVERQRGARWEHPEPPLSIPHEVRMRHTGDRVSGTAGDGGHGVNVGSRFLGRHDRTNDQHGLEPAVADELFGFMAPCWRLLERAKTYMDQDQLQYMKGLILTHVRKPMSREQLLERAESCLQDQEKIFSAFVKMFDRIDQPPLVPLYPAKRAAGIRTEPSPYSVGRSPSAIPVHADPRGFHPPGMPLPHEFEAEQDGSYNVPTGTEGAGHGVFSNVTPQSRPVVLMPRASRGGSYQRQTPYDHSGNNGWRLSDHGHLSSHGVDHRAAENPPRRLSPPIHWAPAAMGLPVLPGSRGDRGYDGEVERRTTRPQQQPSQWRVGASSTAAVVAADAARKPDWRTGPAWGSGVARGQH